MTKISNKDVYIVDTDVSDLDSIIGTDGNSTIKRTKNFSLGSLKDYFKSGLSPLTGGTLRFTEISYTGGLYASVHALVNALDPFFAVEQYHVVVISLNGAKSILKRQNVEVGLDKTPVIAGDFITLPTSVGATGATGEAGAQGIQGLKGDKGDTGAQGVQGIQGLKGDTGLNGANGIDGVAGAQGLQGVQGVAGTNGTNGIDASNNLQRDATTSFTIADSDNNYVIQLKNAGNITVTIPDTLATAKFCCGFIRKGTGEVSFVGGGTMVLNNPVGYRINAQYDPAFVERDNAAQICTLLGNTKI